MKLLDYTRKMSSGGDVSNALKHLTSASQNSIVKDSGDASEVLENCKQFCIKAATSGNFEHISAVLKFVHKTSSEDNWLLASVRVILPCLSQIYCQVLAASDPNKKLGPGTKTNAAITLAIQQKKDALKALCCIFELCIDFCDVVYSHTEKHLGIFLRTSAAVLFGSNFQQLRDTLTETDYAMDELARSSSFALSNIILSYPSLVKIANDILSKRISALLNFLYSSPEISIQKSLVLILRVLYDNSCPNDESSQNLKRRIENGLSATRFGNGCALELFKTFDVNSDDGVEEGERVIAKMFESAEIDSRCFTCDCNVRMTGKVNGRMKKGGSQKVMVDWNKNSIVVHLKNQEPAHFPFYAMSGMKWVRRRKEVRLTYRGDAGTSRTELAIELQPGNRAMLATAIEKRINRLQLLASAAAKSSMNHSGDTPNRKISSWYDLARGSDDEKEGEEGSVDEREGKEGRPEEQQSNDENEHHSEGSEEGRQWDRKTICPKKASKQIKGSSDTDEEEPIPVEEGPPAGYVDKNGNDDEATVFTAIDPDGVLLMQCEEKADMSHNAMEQSDETTQGSPETSEEDQDIVERVVASPASEIPQTPTRAVLKKMPFKGKVKKETVKASPIPDDGSSVGAGDSERICPKADELDSDINEAEVETIPRSLDSRDSSPKADLEVEFSDGSGDEKEDYEKDLNASVEDEELMEEEDDDKSVNVVDEDEEIVDEEIVDDEDDNGEDDGQGSDQEIRTHGRILAAKHARHDGVDIRSHKKRGDESETSEEKSVVSVESSGSGDSGRSKWTLCEDDEKLHSRLLQAVRELMKVRAKQSLKITRQAKVVIQKVGADHAEEDRMLLGKFAGIVKQQVDIHRRKLAAYKRKRMKEFSDARVKLNKLKRGLQEGLKKLKTLKSSYNKQITQTKAQMKRVREQLGKDVQGCVEEDRSKKSLRTKRDSLFEGIAKLLRDD